jgi:hypothetical protein
VAIERRASTRYARDKSSTTPVRIGHNCYRRLVLTVRKSALYVNLEHENFTSVKLNGIRQQLDAQEQVGWPDRDQIEV